MSDPKTAPTPKPTPRWLQILVLIATALAGGAVGHVPFKAVAPQAITLNPNWNVSAWFIDPANSTGCASDGNNGTSSTCGSAGSGVGPFLTWHQLNDIRWGCLGSPRGCPRFTDGAAHTVTFLSSHSTNADPVITLHTLEAGSSFVLKAALPSPTLSASFTSVGANWNASCAIANVRDTINTIGVIGDLLLDTGSDGTATTSVQWCQEGSTTHICRNSIPMTAVTAPPSALQTPALWTTASGGANGGTGLGNTDTYQLYTAPIAVNLVDIEPTIVDWNGSNPTNGDFVYRIKVLDPGGQGRDPITVGPGVTFYESTTDRVINLVGGQSNVDDGWVNCRNNGGLMGTRLATGHFWHWIGGTMTSNMSICNVTGNGVAIDGFATVFANCSFMQGVSFGLVDTFPQTAITLTLAGYSTLSTISPGYGGGSPTANGVDLCLQSNTLNLLSGVFAYDSSHSLSAGVMPNTSTQIFEIGGLTTAESHSGTGTVTVTNGITISSTNLDAAASSSGFGSFAYGNGGIIRKL